MNLQKLFTISFVFLLLLRFIEFVGKAFFLFFQKQVLTDSRSSQRDAVFLWRSCAGAFFNSKVAAACLWTKAKLDEKLQRLHRISKWKYDTTSAAAEASFKMCKFNLGTVFIICGETFGLPQIEAIL